MTKSTFAGLTADALRFFGDLENNNNREWFEASRPRYLKSVKEPMERFAAAISAGLTRIAPAYATEPRRALFRIYRDTRFSSNKAPYKTNSGALFFHSALPKNEAAAFYVEISSKHVGVAGGVYLPGPEYLRLIRSHLLENHERLHKHLKSRSLRNLLGELQGESLTRPPKGYPADHPAIGLIKRKQWYFWRELEPALATSPRLAGEVLKYFEKMLPVVEFFNEPLLAQRKRLAPLILDF
ncbi:MAG: TIGR02453 family protein [Bryobacteraceae bacterium]|nr:TIGR02453 family protein [Bryobacteraceae bacterium]